MEKLNIKHRFQKQYFEILDDGILVDLHTAKHKLKYQIPFEEIQTSQHIQKGEDKKIINGLYFSIYLNVILAFGLMLHEGDAPLLAFQMIFVIMSILFIALTIKASYGFDEKHIKASKHLYFVYTKKNMVKVDTFINLIYQRQKDFYRKKYYLIDHILPYNTQIQRYIWLYENKYIDENEYEIIKENLDTFFNFSLDINT